MRMTQLGYLWIAKWLAYINYITKKNINLTGTNFIDLFELSITDKQINIYIEGGDESYKDIFLRALFKNEFIVIDPSIESLFGLTLSKLKCLTYFSALNAI